MKTVIIYDSLYGNTEKIADSMAQAIGANTGDVKMLRVGQAPLDLFGVELLILGSPTHGGRPTPAMQGFLKKIPAGALKNIKVAAFDTRFLLAKQFFLLKLLMKIIGYASPKIAQVLKNKGGNLVTEPAGFIVESKEGPLKQGEIVRASDWAKGLK